MGAALITRWLAHALSKISPLSLLRSKRIKDKECHLSHITIPSSSLKLPSNQDATGESKGRFLQWGGQGKLQSSTVQHIIRNIMSGGTIQNQVRQLLSKEVKRADVNSSFQHSHIKTVCVSRKCWRLSSNSQLIQIKQPLRFQRFQTLVCTGAVTNWQGSKWMTRIFKSIIRSEFKKKNQRWKRLSTSSKTLS